MNFAVEGRDRDAMHRWPRERPLALLRADAPYAILSRGDQRYSYCGPRMQAEIEFRRNAQKTSAEN